MNELEKTVGEFEMRFCLGCKGLKTMEYLATNQNIETYHCTSCNCSFDYSRELELK